jgi:dTDP-4-amino-4,6-dideoxygalactose transaminase
MIAAVARVLESGKVNYWTGDEGRRFEEEFAHSVECRHGIAVANGTLALELGLYALGIGPGDEVIVPSRTFIATASSVAAHGATPICADVAPESQGLSAETVAPLLTGRTRAIIPVHLAGYPCDMDPLIDLAREHSLAVIEDCAQAHGARYKGRPVGSLGDLAAFSFCQDKIITTGGEGGMLVTNRTDLWDRAWRFKDHGKTPDAFYQPAPAGNQFRWLHESFGSNYRLSEMQSAIGRIAVRLLPEWNATRTRHAERLAACCDALPALRTPRIAPGSQHGWYKFYTFVRPDRLQAGWDRDRILYEIQQRGVPCYSGSCSEIYREEAFPQEWKPVSPLPIARALGETSLMLRVDPALGEEQVDAACDAIASVIRQAMSSEIEQAA